MDNTVIYRGTLKVGTRDPRPEVAYPLYGLLVHTVVSEPAAELRVLGRLCTGTRPSHRVYEMLQALWGKTDDYLTKQWFTLCTINIYSLTYD